MNGFTLKPFRKKEEIYVFVLPNQGCILRLRVATLKIPLRCIVKVFKPSYLTYWELSTGMLGFGFSPNPFVSLKVPNILKPGSYRFFKQE